MLWVVVMCFYVVLGHLPYTTPIWGCLPLNFTPHTQSGSLCTAILRDISILCGPFFPSVEGFGGVPPSVGEVWGAHQLFSCPYAHSGTFFCSALCLTFDYGSDYYSVTVVSSGLSSVSSLTVAPSLTGFPVSHGMVPPPPLMPRGSGGVLGSILVPQQQTSSSMPPLAYANYAMGSP